MHIVKNNTNFNQKLIKVYLQCTKNKLKLSLHLLFSILSAIYPSATVYLIFVSSFYQNDLVISSLITLILRGFLSRSTRSSSKALNWQEIL
jgi:hypothetical protein